MYLIKSKTKEDAINIVEGLDWINNFEYLDLMDCNTLKLTESYPDSTKWFADTPIVYNEEEGILLIEYSKNLLKWFLENIKILEIYGISAESVKQFCSECSSGLYCIETF